MSLLAVYYSNLKIILVNTQYKFRNYKKENTIHNNYCYRLISWLFTIFKEVIELYENLISINILKNMKIIRKSKFHFIVEKSMLSII